MDLVVDANEIFAALIKESKTHELIFDERLHLFTTEFFFAEFNLRSEPFNPCYATERLFNEV